MTRAVNIGHMMACPDHKSASCHPNSVSIPQRRWGSSSAPTARRARTRNSCGSGGCSRCSRRSACSLIAMKRMDARRAALVAADVEAPGLKLDLVPLEFAHLGCLQAVPVGDQDSGGVAVTVPATLRASVIRPSTSD